MPRKLTFEEVKKIYEDNGFILDENTYINSKTKMSCHDKLGYKYYIIPQCACDKRSGSHNIASKLNKYSLDNIQRFIEINGGNAKVISKEYISNKDELLIQCECGNIYKTNWDRLHAIKQFTCQQCSINRRAKIQSKDLSLLEEECNNLGFKLIQEESLNANNIAIEDKDGYRYKTTLSNLKMNAESFGKFNRFSIKNPFEIYNMKHYLKINDLQVKFAYNDIENFSAKSDYVDFICCECGRIFKATWAQIYNKRQRCPLCVKKKSNIEYKIETYLKEINIEYEAQKTFEDCKHKRRLPFDFYLPKYNYIIEVNGSQHYYESPIFTQTLADRQRIDKIKKDYCVTHNIKYLEIPFWHITKSELYKTEINNIINLN